MISDLLTKPLNSGKAEIEAAPTMHRVAVTGMVLYSPPRSEPLIRPVMCSTAPIDMNSSPLKITSLKAWATAPLSASAVPMPMPQTMKPSWLIRL